jgi:hypothetical protein
VQFIRKRYLSLHPPSSTDNHIEGSSIERYSQVA